jgi:hypothetical protein
LAPIGGAGLISVPGPTGVLGPTVMPGPAGAIGMAGPADVFGIAGVFGMAGMAGVFGPAGGTWMPGGTGVPGVLGIPGPARPANDDANSDDGNHSGVRCAAPNDASSSPAVGRSAGFRCRQRSMTGRTCAGTADRSGAAFTTR